MKLGISGALGSMGRIIGGLAADFDFEIVAALEHKANENLGRNYSEFIFGNTCDAKVSENLDVKPDVLIDFTLPQALENVISQCLTVKCPLLSGTTGLTNEHIELLENAGKKIPVMYSSNFSIGIAVLNRLVKQASSVLYPAGFDIEIVEAHHRKKADAPSGTALTLGKSAAAGAGLDFEKAAKFSREGITGERTREEIGFSVIRGGTIPGEHSVIYAGEQEIVEITHKAQSREIFVRGALQAAKWLATQKPGFYTIDDFLRLRD